MFTYRHDRQNICLLNISMGRGYVAPSGHIHRPVTSQALKNIWAVSGYVLLIHIIMLIVYSVS